ncbi:MAG: lactonase family protein, partial [Armatimonadetes bacterium]|nr:lactonase family protein [Armatimonadota bacterium]
MGNVRAGLGWGVGAAALAWLTAGGTGGSQAGAQGNPPAAPPPSAVVLRAADLGLFAPGPAMPEHEVGIAALSPDARLLYIGAYQSYRVDRRNLAVIPLDAAGRPAGLPRRYRDSDLTLPEGTRASINALEVDWRRRKLYLGLAHASRQPVPLSRLLTVYDLDAGGEPTGAPRTYEAGNPGRHVDALALHPRLGRLYLTGFGGPDVYVYSLNPRGEPVGPVRTFPVGGPGKFSVAVSEDGRHLYLGTHPNRLQVLALNAQGDPVGPPRIFQAAPV